MLEKGFVAFQKRHKQTNADMADSRVALITGITGQDGSYLAEFLLEKGYMVHGLIRRSSSVSTSRIEALYQDRHVAGAKLVLHYGDLLDGNSMLHLLATLKPTEVYNLAAQSHVQVSFEVPCYTSSVDGFGVLLLLENLRALGLHKTCRVYQASTSELFGSSPPPQSETTPFHPRSPYAVAKQFAFWTIVNHRETYGTFAVNGLLFNHESERRGITFVTRKITRAVAAICAGTQKKLFLGNLDAKRDWGYAPDYVEAMWLMLQQDVPRDLVIATGESHSVREFVELAFKRAGHVIKWTGKGLEERGSVEAFGEVVVVHPDHFRPCEVENLHGDPLLARETLGWSPRTSFIQLVNKMVDHDVEEARSRACVR